MKFTNKFNLPDTVVRALTYDPYDRLGDVSVTTLLQPARKLALTRLHDDEIVEDVTDRIWSFFGRMGHVVLEQAATRTDPFEALFAEVRNLEEHTLRGEMYSISPLLATFHALPLIEERICARITGSTIEVLPTEEAKRLTGVPHEGVIVAGKADHVDHATGTIRDWKNVRTYSHIRGTSLPDWRKQLNTYALLYGLHFPGVHFNTLEVFEFLHDWDEKNAVRAGYPDHNIFMTTIPRDPDDVVFHFMQERAAAILDALAGNIPLCTEEERWYRHPELAVYSKPGAARARKVFRIGPNDPPDVIRAEADAFATSIKGTLVERRPVNARCDRYCAGAPFCTQYQDLLEKYDTLYGPAKEEAEEV